MSRSDLVLPRYGEASLAEVLPSIAVALGAAPGGRQVLAVPPSDSYVVFLVDGLGERLLRRHAAHAPYLAGLLEGAATLTAPLPSTTATSLTSLGTGLPPGMHGVAGFTTRIPGSGRLLNALDWDPSVDARRWQPHATVFEQLARRGVRATVVNQRSFRNKGLTVASMRGAEFVGANTAGERIAATVVAAARPPALTYTYDSELDATGHRQGCESAAWRHQLRMVDEAAAQLRSALPRGTCLVVTGDHGMVDVPGHTRLDVDTEPELADGVVLFGGEARFRQLYCVAGAAPEVAERWRQRLGADVLVLERAAAVEAGWFGEVAPAVLERLGDVLVACIGDMAILSKSRFPMEARLLGLHGSLAGEEMLVPLLVDPGE